MGDVERSEKKFALKIDFVSTPVYLKRPWSVDIVVSVFFLS